LPFACVDVGGQTVHSVMRTSFVERPGLLYAAQQLVRFYEETISFDAAPQVTPQQPHQDLTINDRNNSNLKGAYVAMDRPVSTPRQLVTGARNARRGAPSVPRFFLRTLKPNAAALFCGAALMCTVSPPARSADLVPKISHDQVLQTVASGRDLVFIDAREAAEHEEERLPGALQLPLRDVSSAQRLKSVPTDALLIAYCIKDFRGFEVARALQRLGYSNVRVLNDPGLQGWKRAKLPTAGTLPAVDDAHAVQALRQRARP
jgi:rhodanese-related sulfurtransferase